MRDVNNPESAISPENHIASESDSKVDPIPNLPPEIASEIFLHFLPVYPECPPPSGSTSPVLLPQICRHWREIALSTPRLWRAIKIVIRVSGGKYPQALDRLTTWLARSAESPLSLHIQMARNFSFLRLFVHEFVPHRHRLEYLVVEGPFKLFSSLRGDMPLLQSLTLTCPNHSSREPPTDIFSGTPKLMDVVLCTFDKRVMLLPLAQLTSLSVEFVSPPECTEILRIAVNLVRCTFTIYTDREETNTPDPVIPVHHHRLRHLTFRPVDGQVIDGLLRVLTLPGLQTLKIYKYGFTLTALAALLAHSQCTLLELRVTHVGFTEVTSEATYREALPSIVTIAVDRLPPGMTPISR
ncbi:hypothetical protein C8R46DRAFT_1341827 [Mycena filopes]|nr:hypothetical protein C8R46DRAFT_1341827 [Mycena filopes]